MIAKEMLDIYREHGGNLTLAFNIKSDGLQMKLKKLLVEGI